MKLTPLFLLMPNTLLDNFTPEMVGIINAIEDTGLFRQMCPPNYCLALNYPVSSQFSAHLDSRYRWGETVVGISLGAPSIITFHPYKENKGRGDARRINSSEGKGNVSLELPRRSVYIMFGDARRGQFVNLFDDVQ